MIDDEAIKSLADQGKSQREIARELGIHYNTVNRHLKGHVYATSTLHKFEDGNGEVVLQWVKEKHGGNEETIREVYADMAKELPRLDPIPPPESSDSDLLNLYTITDYHMGMLAWHKEGGVDWDIKIAERTLTSCFQYLLDSSPSAKVGLINQLGDFLHSDGMMPVTPTSGHILDQDGRFTKIVQTTIRVLRRLISMALIKHEIVYVVLAEGNHDMASSIWLRELFTALYENEPRVRIDSSVLPFYAYQHGETMLAFHHGHLVKNSNLPLLLAAKFPKIWGGTSKRYCHTGHRHHVEEKEHPGIKLVQHPTLAAADAYSARGGWMSEREATSITYHTRHGQVARNTVTPEMLESAA